MAGPAYWKGYLKLSLVTCPVRMMPATSGSERIRFHTLNRDTGNRVRSRYVDSVSGDVVDDTDQVMGYAIGKDDYVLLEDEELDAVALESVHTIDIDTFVEMKSVDRIWLDTPHYLVASDEVGLEAFAVIRDAMARADVGGLSRLVLARREHRILVEPRGRGLLVWTLRYRDQVRPADDYLDEDEAEVSERGLKLARDLIEEKTRAWGDDLVEDRVQDNLKKLIAAKKKGRGRKPGKAEPPAGGAKVISIMDALRRSIDEATREEKPRGSRPGRK